MKTKGLVTRALLSELENLPDRYISGVFSWLRAEYNLEIRCRTAVTEGVAKFLSCLGTTSLVCSYLFPSPDNVQLIRSLCESEIKCDSEKYLWSVAVKFLWSVTVLCNDLP